MSGMVESAATERRAAASNAAGVRPGTDRSMM
jgi:hypothetical protein